MDWCRYLTDTVEGGKKAGELVGGMPKTRNFNAYGQPGTGTLNIPQPELCRILLDEVAKSDSSFDTELVGIYDEEDEFVTAEANYVKTGDTKMFSSRFLVAADGEKSKTRGLLGIPFSGHTWPEKLVATDVWLINNDESPITTTFLMDPIYYTVITPLTLPTTRQKSLWGVAFALNPDETRSDDELPRSCPTST